jgi:hypothetical protein
MFPIIPIVCWAMGIIGSGGLIWYGSLSKEDRGDADAIAAKYASDLFDKAVNQLTVAEAKQVHGLVRQHFGDN